jgi:hypothetical protein
MIVSTPYFIRSTSKKLALAVFLVSHTRDISISQREHPGIWHAEEVRVQRVAAEVVVAVGRPDLAIATPKDNSSSLRRPRPRRPVDDIEVVADRRLLVVDTRAT